MTTWPHKHGDSFWLDVKCSIAPVNKVWPGTWFASWTVKTALADLTSVASGTLIPWDGTNGTTNIPGQFRLIIDPISDGGPNIPNGTYFLTVEIRNSDKKFKKEVIQDTLVVSQEGV
jgi:hypothetical protein